MRKFRLAAMSALALGSGGMVAGLVVSCGKTANAVIPVEIYIPYSDATTSMIVRYRTDLTYATGVNDAWTTSNSTSGHDLALQYNIAKSGTPWLIAALKASIVGYTGNYAALDTDPGWKELFYDINEQRSGSGAVMTELSQIHLVDTGYVIPGPVAPKTDTDTTTPKGWAVFTVSKIVFDGQSTTGNSPNEAYLGKLKNSAGHHYELALSDPIYFAIGFTNTTSGTSVKTYSDTKDLDNAQFTTIANGFAVFSQSEVNTWDGIVVGASATAEQKKAFSDYLNDTYQKKYTEIMQSIPAASNRYKAQMTKEQFHTVWGTNAPVKVTTDA